MRCSLMFLLLHVWSSVLSLTTAFAPIAPISAAPRHAASSIIGLDLDLQMQMQITAITSTSNSNSRRTRSSRSSRSSTTTQLFQTTGVDRSTPESAAVDYDALLKYHGAVVIQMSLIGGLFFGLDTLVDITGISESVPTLALVPFFYVLSLKSRVFNPLNNARPNIKKAIDQGSDDDAPPSRGFGDRIMPSWTPPGVIFPIMWLLIIGPLRAYTSSLVWQANGHHFLDPALMALVFHLSVGDVWNTMNNAEQRFGASVTGVLCVTATALNAAYQYYTVDESAGHLLGLPMIWFAVATSLITATWQLNPSLATGRIEPLYPIVREEEEGGKSTTQFAWFGGNDDNSQ